MKKLFAVSLLLLFGFTSCAPFFADSAYYASTTTIASAAPAFINPEILLNHEDYLSGEMVGGRWSDIENWGFWESLSLRNDLPFSRVYEIWQLHTENRVGVHVSCGGTNVSDAVLTLMNSAGAIFSARSDRNGNAEIFRGLSGESSGPYTLSVISGNQTNSEVFDDFSEETRLELELGGFEAPEEILDLMFVFDATGSMSDELSYFQTKMQSLLEGVRALNPAVTIRLSASFFRDADEAYTVLSDPFTTNESEFLDFFNMQSASGGGDYAEAVDEALSNAVFDHEWSDSAVSRILFLITDAPPHRTSLSVYRMKNSILHAAERGVRVIPVLAVGVDQDTEFLYRTAAVFTGGSFVFLADERMPALNGVEPEIGDVEILPLKEILAEIISESLSD